MNSSNNIIILVGVPNVGKSTLSNYVSKKYNYSIVATDKIKKEIYGNSKNYDIKLLFKKQKELIESLMKNNNNIIADSNNSTYNYRREIIRIAKKYNYNYYNVYIYSDLEEIKIRLKSNNKFHVIDNLDFYLKEIELTKIDYKIYNKNINDYFNDIDKIINDIEGENK